MSLPSRERGLKSLRRRRHPAADHEVAPLAGAWIEITRFLKVRLSVQVAPLAGAWIEIGQDLTRLEMTCGRSPRGSVD